MTNTSSYRRFFGLAALVLTLLTITVPSAMATHLRGGTITWTPISGAQPGFHRVQFTIQEAQRWDYPSNCAPLNPPPGYSATLSCFAGTLFFYPDSNNPSVQLSPNGTVTSVNAAEDWMVATFTFTYDYSSCAPAYTAYLLGANRLSTLELGHDSPEEEIVTVSPCATNGGPVAAVPAVLAVPLLTTTTFDLGAAVTDIDPTVHLTYRVASPAEMLDQATAPCLNNGNTATSMAPPGFSINANTGVVTWITAAIAGAQPCLYPAPQAGDLWAVQIIVEARDTNNNLVASTPIDLMMKFVTPVGALPTLTISPSGTQTTTPGNPVTFTATGNSINPGAKITLNATGLPVGATASNLNQTLTPPITSAFSWYPTTAQTGTYVITYTVTDNNFQQATASKTIVVAAAPPSAVCSANFSTPYNQAAAVAATVYDPNNEVLNVVFSLDGNPVQTFTGVVAYPQGAIKSINQTYGPVGPHVVSVVATDPHGVTGSCSTNVTVTKANQAINFATLPDVFYGTPDFGITATATSGLSVSFAANGACTVNGNTVHITGAGGCSITASQPGDTNYNAAANVVQAFNIGKAALTVSAGSYSGVYDGASHALSACTVSANFDSLTCTNNPAGPVGPDVGGATVIPVVSGDTSNYNVTTNNGSWSITALGVTITAGSYTGVYDGNPHAPSACTSSYPGVTCSNSPTPVGPDVSSGPVAPVASIVTGIPADYTITKVNGSYSITPLTVTITGGSYTGVYDGSPHSPSACSSTYPGVSCSNTPASVGPNVSSGPVAPAASIVTGIAADYTINPVNGSFSITPLTVTITGGSYSGVYDGNTHTPSACSSSFAGLTCTNNPASVGPDVGGAAVAPVANYGNSSPSNFTVNLTNGSWSITPLAVNLAAGIYSGVYDGSPHAPSSCVSSFPAGVGCTNNPASVGAGVGSGPVSPVASYVSGIAADYQLGLTNGAWSIIKAPTSITLTCPTSVVYTGAAQTPCTATVTGPGLNQSVPVTYTNNTVGTATATANFAGDANRAGATATKTFQISYSTGACLGGPGHTILPPIDADGTSVWKQGSTVPAKFRVCDANGNSVGAPGTVASFYLVQIIAGTVTNVDEVPNSTTPDTVFRWTGDQWIFNISTTPLSPGATYIYQITLGDGSVIPFQFGLK